MSYRRLDPEKILETIRKLHQRISERFPNRGLTTVSRDLVGLAEETQARADAIAAPNIPLRIVIYTALAIGFAAMATIGWLLITLNVNNREAVLSFPGVGAALNLVILAGATLFFGLTLEDRIKRRRTLGDLHRFRSIIHVIDMHQLTKDPSVLRHNITTPSSPERTMTPFELARYLDYCSELLSLTSKLAALYVQSLPDPVVVSAVNDIEKLTAELSQKIWQKIAILESEYLAKPD